MNLIVLQISTMNLIGTLFSNSLQTSRDLEGVKYFNQTNLHQSFIVHEYLFYLYTCFIDKPKVGDAFRLAYLA